MWLTEGTERTEKTYSLNLLASSSVPIELFFRVFAVEDDDADEPLVDTQTLSIADIESKETTVSLPKQHRCAAHTLNLIAKDSQEAQRKCHRSGPLATSTFEKAQLLWTKQSRSPKVAGEFFRSVVFFVQVLK